MKKYTLALLSLLGINSLFAQDSNLELTWAAHYSPQKNVQLQKIVTSATNQVYTIGQYTGEHQLTTTGAAEIITPKEKHQVAFVQQLNKEGQLLWKKEYSVLQKGKENTIWLLDLVHNQAEDSYLLGAFEGQVTLEGKSVNSLDKKTYFIQQLNKSGQVLSTQYLAAHLNFDPQSIHLNATQQYLYLVGTTTTEIAKTQSKLPTIQKRTLGGEIVWNKKLQSPSSNANGSIADCILDAQDNLYILGNFNRSMDFDPATDTEVIKSVKKGNANFLLKLDKGGQFQWVQTLADTYGAELALDATKHVYWVGVATANLYSNSNTQPQLTLNGSSDIVLQQLTTNGQLLSTKLIHKNENEADNNPSLAINEEGAVFVSWITTVYDRNSSGVIVDNSKYTTNRHLVQLNTQLAENWNFSIEGGRTPNAYLRLVGSTTQKHVLYYGTAPVGADLAPGSSTFVASPTDDVAFVGKLGIPYKLIPVNRNGMTATPESGLKKGETNIANLKGSSIQDPNQTTTTKPSSKGEIKLQKTPAANNPTVKYPK